MSHDPHRSDGTPYWSTAVSSVRDGAVKIRGYDLEELIGSLSFTAATFLLIRGRVPRPNEVAILDCVLTGILDYGLSKPGTVAARYIASANPSMASGLAGALLAVGPHTLAPEDTARFVTESYERFRASGLSADKAAEEEIRALRERKERVPGLGHPMFKVVDPRAQLLKERAIETGHWGERAEYYEAIHRSFTRQPGRESIPINDVGMIAVILTELGFTPEETTAVAAISTLPGVAAHIAEELRSGKPIRVAPEQTVEYDPRARSFEADWSAAGWPATSQ